MSLTDLPASSDAGTMTNNEPRPRSDQPRRRTFSTCYLGLFTAMSLLTGDWGPLLGGAFILLIGIPGALLCGYVVYRLYGWLLRVDS